MTRRHVALVAYWALFVASVIYLAVAVAWWAPFACGGIGALFAALGHLGRKR